MFINKIYLALFGVILLLCLAFGINSYTKNESKLVAEVPGADFVIYMAQCDNDASSMADCQKPKKLDRIAYKIDTQRSEVWFWYPDIISAAPTYTVEADCEVKNKENWNCPISNYGMVESKYFDRNYIGLINISFAEWLTLTKHEAKVIHSRKFRNPETIAHEEDLILLNEVKKIISLPENESPTIATVVDPDEMKDNPFFINAKKGFKVLIYTQAKLMVLYDPFLNKVVNTGPLNLSR